MDCSMREVETTDKKNDWLPSWGGHSIKRMVGFPGGAVVESLPASAGHTGSSPGLGGSHMLRSGWAHEPQLLSLRVWSLCSATGGAAIVRGLRTAMKSGPRLPQLEKALAQKRRPNTANNKSINKLKKKKKENGDWGCHCGFLLIPPLSTQEVTCRQFLYILKASGIFLPKGIFSAKEHAQPGHWAGGKCQGVKNEE